MPKHITNIRSIGHSNIWKFIHEINAFTPNAIPKIDKKLNVNLLMAENSKDIEEMYTKSLAALGLELKCFSPEQWSFNKESAQIDKLKDINDADLQIVYGLEQDDLDVFCTLINGNVFNASNADNDICAMLGDIALIYSLTPNLEKIRISWVGGSTPLANSLVEMSMFIPFELFMALPVDKEPNRSAIGFALSAGAKIFLTRDVHIATDETYYVYFGDIEADTKKDTLDAPFNPINYIKSTIAEHAQKNVKFLRGAHSSCQGQIDLSWINAQDNLYEKQTTYTMYAQICVLSWLLSE